MGKSISQLTAKTPVWLRVYLPTGMHVLEGKCTHMVFPPVVNRNPYTLPTRKKAITTVSSSYVRSLVRNLSEAQGSSVKNEVTPPASCTVPRAHKNGRLE